MTTPPTYGKLDRKGMEEIYRHLGERNDEIIVGPGRGLDNAVISIDSNRVMVVTTDPVSIMPSMGMETSAWLSVHLIASDFTTSGLKPQFASFTFNFPEELARSDRVRFLRAVGAECKKLGISVVSGHTGSYPGARFTVVGGGMMFGFGKPGGYVTPAMSAVGDSIFVTKGAAIEATASLSISFPRHTAARVGRRLARAARGMVSLCSTVEDALAASEVGLGKDKVTSMHDATEGGVLGALAEMASASNHAFEVMEERIPVSNGAQSVCASFGINPLTSLGDGALLIACGPQTADELKSNMGKARIPVTEIGVVKDGRGLWVSKAGAPPRRARPARDGYWDAYNRSVAMGLE